MKHPHRPRAHPPTTTSPTPSSRPSPAWTRTSVPLGVRAGASSTGCPCSKRLDRPRVEADGRPARPARRPAAARAPRAQAPPRRSRAPPTTRPSRSWNGPTRVRTSRPRPPRSRGRRPRSAARVRGGRCPCRTRHGDRRRRRATSSTSMRVDHHLARLAHDLDALPGQLVEAAAAVVDGRVHRRHLLDAAQEAAGRRPPPAPGRRPPTGASATTRPLRSPVSVVTPSRRVATYSLSWSARYGHQLGRLAEQHRQHAGGVGVEGAGVADTLEPEPAPDEGDGVERGDPGRLVDDQDAGRQPGGQPRSAHRLAHRGEDVARHRLQVAGHGEAGGVGMAAAAELGGDPLHVDVALAAQAHLHLLAALPAAGRRRARRRSSADSSPAPRTRRTSPAPRRSAGPARRRARPRSPARGPGSRSASAERRSDAARRWPPTRRPARRLPLPARRRSGRSPASRSSSGTSRCRCGWR